VIIREVTLPLRLVTLENQREHWAKKAKRAKEQRGLAVLALGGCLLIPPGHYRGWQVTLTRIAPRELDPGNFHASFKHVQDGVADWLGIDDGSKVIQWLYEQEKGRPREYAVRIHIELKEVAA